jgi:hypothetical protein
MQQLRQLADARVRQSVGGAVEHQQARGVALGERLLGDRLRVQVVVEVAETQG